MQTLRVAVAIVAGILPITAIGEPIRRFRLKHTEIRPLVGKNMIKHNGGFLSFHMDTGVRLAAVSLLQWGEILLRDVLT
ncbi:MAG: hypothetical protein WB795_04875, partial [Candidatus Acidiferrales bacterium]